METTARRLKAGLAIRGMKQADIVAATGIGKSSISTYLSGEYEPKQRNIYKLAQALNVSEAWLMGADVPMERQEIAATMPKDLFDIPNIFPLPDTYKVPRLGTIACGTPILAEQNIEDYDWVSGRIRCDFTLRCKGDSMINARIFDGDIVYIKAQPAVENGEIAAVLIDDEATLKRVELYDDHIALKPENPTYKPIVLWGEEMNSVRIIGKAVYFASKVR